MRTISFIVLVCAVAIIVAASPAPGVAQKSERSHINDEEYATLIDDFLSVLPNSFDVAGTNPDGSRYRGQAYVNFDPQTGDLLIDWRIGEQQFTGRGPLLGGEFIVDWGQPRPVIYTVQRDGSLFGTWADGAASETLRFAP